MAERGTFCDVYGFDPERRKSRLDLLDLTEQDEARGRRLQELVIGPHGDEIIDLFYDRLQENARFREIVERGYDLRALKLTQRDYMLSLGVGFHDADYFESRLRVGLVHARVGVPLSLYQCAFRLLQQLIIDRLRTVEVDVQEALALADFVLKITTLDMSLAIETYHRRRMTVLEHSLDLVNQQELALLRRTQMDPLTGTASRERLLEVLEEALDGVRDVNEALCVALVDLDHFKHINDAQGHLTGDAVLRDVAGRMVAAVRDFDLIGRYGGEEFILLLRNADPTTARHITERVRKRVGEAPINVNGVKVGDWRLRVRTIVRTC
jgi:two-component system cell cycle response regulator